MQININECNRVLKEKFAFFNNNVLCETNCLNVFNSYENVLTNEENNYNIEERSVSNINNK